jgi:hypothetical protein
MTDKTYLLKMNDEHYCRVCAVLDSECQGNEFKHCKGNLKDRPEWCPLVAIDTDSQENWNELYYKILEGKNG